MKLLRATIRLMALCCVTGFYYLRWLAGVPFLFMSPRRTLGWRNRNFSDWARALASIMGLSIQVRNTPPVGPFLLIANHLSYVDIVVLGSQLNCAFVAKSEVARWPILGLISASMNTIFIDRKRNRDLVRAMSTAKATLDHGLGLVVFAEGTSTGGGKPLPFKSSMLDFAARQRMPVHYASIEYQVAPHERPARESVCWWGTMTFPDHLFRLLQLSEFQAHLTFGAQPIVNEDRRLLAAELWSAVSAQLNPLGVET
jgi:1-acyl-sn-glycerol-3-phosphate acyltransferase